jgi:plastocyanin
VNNGIKIIIAVVVVALLGVGGYYAMRQSAPVPSAAETDTINQPAQTEPNDESEAIAATITYTDDGFTPAVTTVKSGETVKITNNSSDHLELDSDPHPAHTDNSELNVGIVAPGQSRTFTLSTKGTWGIHNHLDASNTAEVNVE